MSFCGWSHNSPEQIKYARRRPSWISKHANTSVLGEDICTELVQKVQHDHAKMSQRQKRNRKLIRMTSLVERRKQI